MLLHIRPRLFSGFRNVDLTRFEIQEIGLCLTGGVDLVTRRPYPNKRYAVACRKIGRKAVDGILIETDQNLDEFHASAQWAVAGKIVVTHIVQYKLLDHDFDAASDDMTLWYACGEELGGWQSRWPARTTQNFPPVQAEPVMEVVAGRERPRTVNQEEDGIIITRWHSFEMPTLERGRVEGNPFHNRAPSIDAAFHASVMHRTARCRSPLWPFIQ